MKARRQVHEFAIHDECYDSNPTRQRREMVISGAWFVQILLHSDGVIYHTQIQDRVFALDAFGISHFINNVYSEASCPLFFLYLIDVSIQSAFESKLSCLFDQ
jgi:hypothetical protein